MKHICVRCSEEFVSRVHNAKYCPVCRPLAYLEGARKYKQKHALRLKTHRQNKQRERNDRRRKICARCGAVFKPHGNNSTCCDTCRPIVASERTKEYYRTNAERINAERRTDLPPQFKEKRCERCGVVFNPKTGNGKYCINCRPIIIAEQKRIHDARHYAKHHDKIRSHANAHPEVARAGCHARRARKRNNGGTHTGQDEVELVIAQEARCFYCNKLLFHTLNPLKRNVEHVVALHNGGSNNDYNIVYSCADCNQTKRRLADCPDALLMELIRDGKISGSQAFHKSHTLKLARERKYNPILFVSRLKAEYCG